MKTKAIIDLERKIADGLRPRCPECGKDIVIGRKEEGASGGHAYKYKCSDATCRLPPGHAYMPWYAALFKALQKKAIQLSIAAIGSITLTGVIGFATGLIHWKGGPPRESPGVESEVQRHINTADNNFERTQLEEVLRQYKQMVAESRLDSSRGTENVYFMARGVDAANISIQGIGAFSPQAWSRELSPYVLANYRAAERGVEVKRVFIIPPGLTEDEFALLIKVMREQREKKIKVFYTFKDQIQLIPHYARNPFTPCALFDDKYFGYDLSTDLTGRYPSVSRMTWDREEMDDKSPFPEIYRSRYVYPFEDNSDKAIREQLGLPSAAQ